MPNSNAKKQQAYHQRVNSDPERRALYLQKRKDNYKRRKEKGLLKTISDLGRRDAKAQRKNWRERQQKSRQNKKISQEASGRELTATASPELTDITWLTLTDVPSPSTSKTSSDRSQQKTRGRKLVRRDRAACYVENRRLKSLLSDKKKQVEKYKKRCERLIKHRQGTGVGLSPRTQVKRMIGTRHVPKDVVKKLVFTSTVVKSIETDFKRNQSKKKKRQICDLVYSAKHILKKYRMQGMLKEAIGISNNMYNKSLADKKKMAKTPNRKVTNFYLQEDVSRVANGKKLTITRRKNKKQKRFLTDNLIILFKRFSIDNPNVKMSYTSFTRLRPFWVLQPSEKDRDTCMCKSCENPRLILEKLVNLKLSEDVKCLSNLPKAITCNDKLKVCAYNECNDCKNKCIAISEAGDIMEKNVSLPQWVAKKEQRDKLHVSSGTTTIITVSRSVKEAQFMTANELVNKFNLAATTYTRHLFNINHQYSMFRYLQTNMRDNDCIIQIDFSENFTLKYGNQIQDAHFGASLQQASLHTGVLHLYGEKPISFCTISPNLQHGPPAIWEHLKPVLDLIQRDHPNVKNLHFLSDGPSSQYKQKGNFYLFSKVMHERGFLTSTWNFWESGHGRGAPDGVGGAVKRRADDMVRHGQDLPTAEILFEKLTATDTKINIFYISDEDIMSACKNVYKLKPVPKTQLMHQVITTAKSVIHCRELSCFCEYPTNLLCPCYSLAEFRFPTPKDLYSEEDLMNMPIDIIIDAPTDEVSVHDETVTRKTFIHPPLRVSEDYTDAWVIVKYEGQYFPGKVDSITNSLFEVSCMAYSCKNVNKFIWPKKKDVMLYKLDDVVTTMLEPNVLPGGHLEIPLPLWDELHLRNP